MFNNLSYGQIINLTESNLEGLGITKGARHKLLLSIAKLRDRGQMLTELETEIMNGSDLLAALKKLKMALQTPLQLTAGENLLAQFVKVMGKGIHAKVNIQMQVTHCLLLFAVCTQLLMLRVPPDDCIVLFSTICDRVETSEVFADEYKRRLGMWKRQLLRTRQHPLCSPQPMDNHYNNM